jgi:hypothetical protein
MKNVFYWLAATILMITAPGAAAAPHAPILLELFTSEGCSSCPPAESLLDELDRTQPFSNAELIVLSEHVDYWDQLGWKDPYSSAIFSSRQNQYAARVAAPGVYTPQLIIDGQWEAIGSDRGRIRQIVAKASAQSKLPISLESSRSGNSGELHVAIPAARAVRPADVYIVLARNRVTSYVAHGENAHRTLSHTAVAYKMIKLGELQPGALFEKQLLIDLPPTAGQTRVIAYVDDAATGRIIALTHALL